MKKARDSTMEMAEKRASGLLCSERFFSELAPTGPPEGSGRHSGTFLHAAVRSRVVATNATSHDRRNRYRAINGPRTRMALLVGWSAWLSLGIAA